MGALLDVEETPAREATAEIGTEVQQLGLRDLQIVALLQMPQGRNAMGESPEVRVGHPRGLVRPLKCQVELPRENMRKCTVRIEGPAQGIVGAQLHGLLEIRK